MATSGTRPTPVNAASALLSATVSLAAPSGAADTDWYAEWKRESDAIHVERRTAEAAIAVIPIDGLGLLNRLEMTYGFREMHERDLLLETMCRHAAGLREVTEVIASWSSSLLVPD